ncbi:MAG: hypothetical protein OEZ28_14180 [Nitrospinota bacterium]|nr:hypothetical protein [Nitrospinota bacterium]
MRIAQIALVALLAMGASSMAGETAPDLDLINGKVGGTFVGSPRKEFAKRLAKGGETIGTWTAFRDKGYFVQHAGLRNMAGFSMMKGSWPDRLYGFEPYVGKISFGITAQSTLEEVKAALLEGFGGNFVLTLEEERGVWNRDYVAYQLTAWKTDPPFYFEIFFKKNRKVEEIRIKSFPGSYYPQLLRDRALGPHAIEKHLQ